MNEFQRMWDAAGYAKRYARIQRCNASDSRKACACVRVWNRMTSITKGSK